MKGLRWKRRSMWPTINMKKRGLPFSLSAAGWCLTLLVLLPSCTRDKPNGFVSLENGRFVLEGKPFFPLVINYITDLQWNGDSCWACSGFDYVSDGKYRFGTRSEARLQLKSEFRLMREMGFNAVRLGLAPDPIFLPDSGKVMLHSRHGMGTDSLFTLEGPWKARYLDALEDLVDLAQEEGLKVILLLRMRPDNPAFEKHAVPIVDRLKNNPGILAYDLFNEPLYFDIHDRPKREVHEVVKRWRKLLKAHAPHQLVTIGLVGVPEVFAWDPNVLAVDFISFHPYEYEPDQVMNEISWYGEQVDKPWIIGETSLPADNDSVSYADQLTFARKTLAQTQACGGAGYSWWQFKDVKWGRFHSDYMGVMNRQGWTEVGPGLPPIEGTIKPVVEAFQEFDPHAAPGKCIRSANYYNYSSHRAARLTGRLVDSDRRPVEGGVILGWNENWTSSYYTLSKEDGSFELYGDFHFHHWMASATRYSMVRGDCFPNAFLTGKDSIPSYYLGELVLEKVSYANKPGS